MNNLDDQGQTDVERTTSDEPTCPHGRGLGRYCPSGFCGDGSGTYMVTDNDLLKSRQEETNPIPATVDDDKLPHWGEIRWDGAVYADQQARTEISKLNILVQGLAQELADDDLDDDWPEIHCGCGFTAIGGAQRSNVEALRLHRCPRGRLGLWWLVIWLQVVLMLVIVYKL